MQYTNKIFSNKEKSLLKMARGSRLVSVDTVLAAPPDNSWNTIRMHFEDHDIDVNNRLTNITVDEFGTIEDFGLLSVVEATKETLNLPEVGTDTTIFEIGETVYSVTIINDIVDIYNEDSLVAKLEYPQAIAFHTGSGVIILDKEVWFSEMIVLKRGRNINELLYDESINWEDDPDEDPTTHFKFHIEIEEL